MCHECCFSLYHYLHVFCIQDKVAGYRNSLFFFKDVSFFVFLSTRSTLDQRDEHCLICFILIHTIDIGLPYVDRTLLAVVKENDEEG